jgi:hypothetical protein
MLFSVIGIFITLLALLMAIPQNTISQIISFSVGNVFFFMYIGSTLIFLYNRSYIFIIFCILCRPLRCVVIACENLSVFIHTVKPNRKCSINDSIKSEYPFIKDVNENAECTLCNAKFSTAYGGPLDVINHMKTKEQTNWLFKTKFPITE